MAVYYDILLRTDSTLNWYAANPRLQLGEVGIDLTLLRFKVGNGIDRWNELPYMNEDMYTMLDRDKKEFTDKIQRVLEEIRDNKLSADQGIADLRKEFRDTDRDLKSRMKATEERQVSYEAGLTKRQDKYESGVTERQDKYEANLTGEFKAVKEDVYTELGEMEDTRDALSVRLDVIAGQTTEDTEILDARVDALRQAHPNLGHNIRSLHEEVLSAQELLEHTRSDNTAQENLIGKLDARDVHQQEQLDALSHGVTELTLTQSFEQVYRRELQNTASQNTAAIEAETQAREATDAHVEHEESWRIAETEHLHEQVNALSDAVLQGLHQNLAEHEQREAIDAELRAALEAETEAREATDEHVTDHVEREERWRVSGHEHLQEQADTLADTLMQAGMAQREALSRVHGEIERAMSRDDAGHEHQQEQLDTLSHGVTQLALTQSTEQQYRRELQSKTVQTEAAIEAETQAREQTDDHITHEELWRITDAEHLREQVNALSEALLRRMHQSLTEHEQREYIEGEIRASIEALSTHNIYLGAELQEQADMLADTLLSHFMRHKEEAAATERENAHRDAVTAELRERFDDIAGHAGNGILNLTHALRDILGRLKTKFLRQGNNTQAAVEHIQEQADILAGGLMQASINQQEAVSRVQAGVKRAISRNDMEHEHLQEQVDTLAEATMQELQSRYQLEAAVRAIHSPIDWSNEESLHIPEPQCAVVNITGINAMPTSKTIDIPAVMEFWDKQGNYFKKPIVCSAQGAYSMNYPKKNMKFDLLNADGSEFDLKIGNWVVQDGFHLKAYWADFFRGIAVASYRFWDEIMRSNGIYHDRPYKKELIAQSSIAHDNFGSINDITMQLNNEALCHPDGFPCILYLNSTFYGVYSWQLKKHRKNYHLTKSTVEHIHIDGALGTIWNGNINWAAFEIRNPNKLYTMDGKKYDGDAPGELIDETSSKYKASNKDHVRSAQVKRYIQNLAQGFIALKASPTREKYEALFDWQTMRDYLIFSDVLHNWDGITHNAQWTTYDGKKWYISAYDLDLVCQRYRAPLTNHVTTSTNTPIYYAALLYQSELEGKYRELRNSGIISTEHFVSLLEDWTSRVGTNNYELEYERWPNSSHADSVYRVSKWLDASIANMDRLYHYEPDATAEELVQAAEQRHDKDVTTLEDADDIGVRICLRSDEGLQEQIDTLSALAVNQLFDRREEQELNNTRFGLIEQALVEAGMITEGALEPTSTDNVGKMIDDIFSGNTTDTPDTDDEFSHMLDEIFTP